jgi:predicted ATPase
VSQKPKQPKPLFNLAFQDFVSVFTCLEQPFAIFLDDLQWADRSSLKLINLDDDGARKSFIWC